MNTQEIIAYILVVIAVGYLVKTLFFKKKKKSGGGGTDCKCG